MRRVGDQERIQRLVDRVMMGEALRLAERAVQCEEIPVGAIVYRVVDWQVEQSTCRPAARAARDAEALREPLPRNGASVEGSGAAGPRRLSYRLPLALRPRGRGGGNGSSPSGVRVEVEVISQAFNRRESEADPTAHAELIAVREAARRLGDWRLNDWTVAVTLEPCPMCAGMLVNARVGRLVFAAHDPKAGAVESLFAIVNDARLNHRMAVRGGVLAGPAGKMLRTFFRARRRGRLRMRSNNGNIGNGGDDE